MLDPFFCINLDIMLVIMHYALFISHYAGFETHSKLSNFWVFCLQFCVQKSEFFAGCGNFFCSRASWCLQLLESLLRPPPDMFGRPPSTIQCTNYTAKNRSKVALPCFGHLLTYFFGQGIFSGNTNAQNVLGAVQA